MDILWAWKDLWTQCPELSSELLMLFRVDRVFSELDRESCWSFQTLQSFMIFSMPFDNLGKVRSNQTAKIKSEVWRMLPGNWSNTQWSLLNAASDPTWSKKRLIKFIWYLFPGLWARICQIVDQQRILSRCDRSWTMFQGFQFIITRLWQTWLACVYHLTLNNDPLSEMRMPSELWKDELEALSHDPRTIKISLFAHTEKMLTQSFEETKLKKLFIQNSKLWNWQRCCEKAHKSWWTNHWDDWIQREICSILIPNV